MITEQQAREAAEILAEFGSEHQDSTEGGAAQVLTNWTRQELARREADQVERAKPITPEWCKDNGGTGTNEQLWWKCAEGEWLRVTFYERGAVSVVFRGRKLYGVQTVGRMTDLLSALKGGAT